MEHVAAKLVQSGLSHSQVLLCERGIVLDTTRWSMTSGAFHHGVGASVVFDATRTHSSSGGGFRGAELSRSWPKLLLRWCGRSDMEVHDDPDNAQAMAKHGSVRGF